MVSIVPRMVGHCCGGHPHGAGRSGVDVSVPMFFFCFNYFYEQVFQIVDTFGVVKTVSAVAI